MEAALAVANSKRAAAGSQRGDTRLCCGTTYTAGAAQRRPCLLEAACPSIPSCMCELSVEVPVGESGGRTAQPGLPELCSVLTFWDSQRLTWGRLHDVRTAMLHRLVPCCLPFKHQSPRALSGEWAHASCSCEPPLVSFTAAIMCTRARPPSHKQRYATCCCCCCCNHHITSHTHAALRLTAAASGLHNANSSA